MILSTSGFDSKSMHQYQTSASAPVAGISKANLKKRLDASFTITSKHNSQSPGKPGRAFYTLRSSSLATIIKKAFQASIAKNLKRHVKTPLSGSIKKPKRYRSSYTANKTISRMSSARHAHIVEPKNSSSLVASPCYQDLRDRIQDHAYRRMQIFYYLCAAYYDEGCRVQIAPTRHQHGKSKCLECSAAHSSILPNVSDDFFDRLKHKLSQAGIDTKTAAKLRALGVPEDKIIFLQSTDINTFWISFCFDGFAPENMQQLVAQKCPFYDAMNSTVELPEIVNRYDCLIEGVMREIALGILNQTASGKLMPYEAAKQFEKELQAFFFLSAEETDKKIELISTFYAYEVFLKRMEELIWADDVKNKSQWVANYLKGSKNLLETGKQIDALKRHSLKVKTSNWPIGHQQIADIIAALVQKDGSFEETVDKITKDRHLLDELYGKLQLAVFAVPAWRPAPVEIYLRMLKDSRHILELQSCASWAPPFQVLYGKPQSQMTKMQLVEKVFMQKLEVITRKCT